DGGELRALARGGKKCTGGAGEKRHVTSRTILENEREPAGCAYAGNGRRRKRKRNALPEAGEPLVHAVADELVLLFSSVPFAPFLQRHEEKRVVGRPGQAQQAEADDAGRRFDAGRLGQQVLNLAGG